MKQLKSWPLAFGQIVGRVRHHDCRLGLDVTPGETLLYREFSPMSCMYSGREMIVTVGAVTTGTGEAFDPLTGIAENMTIFTIASVEMLPSKQPTPELEG